MTDPYAALADDYDWLLDDDALVRGVAINQPATARLLFSLGPGASVLDAACGTGVDAAVLARKGVRVVAADASPAMARKAEGRFAAEGLAVPVLTSSWPELASATSERFDAVLCVGNSLVHAAGEEEMVASLRGLRALLRPGGRLVVDSRNWEKLHAARRIVEVAKHAVARDGRRCIVVYAWEIPDRFEDEHVAHLAFVFDERAAVVSHVHEVRFRPVRVTELQQRLKAAGLRVLDGDFDEDAERYAIVAAES